MSRIESEADANTAVAAVPADGNLRSGWAQSVLLFLGFASLYMVNAGHMVLVDPDESRCVLIASRMVETGDYLAPHFPLQEGEYFDKPALYFWILALSFKGFGVSIWAARLVTAVGGGLLVALMHRMGRRLYGGSGLSEAFILGSSAMMVLAGRFVRMDVWFTLFITATVYCWTEWYFGRQGRILLLLAGLGIGAAVLTKGLLGLLVPAATILFHLLARRDPQWRRVPWKPAMVVMVVAIASAGPWFWSMEHSYPGYLEDFFYRHHFLRATTGTFGRSGTLLYLPAILLVSLFPYTPLFMGEVVQMVRRRIRGLVTESDRISWGWLLGALAPVALSRTQLPVYVLPAFPPAVLICARRFRRLLERPEQSSSDSRMLLSAHHALIVICVLVMAVTDYVILKSLDASLFAVRVAVVGGIWWLSQVCWSRGALRCCIAISACAPLLASLSFAWNEGPPLTRHFSTADLGRRVAALRRPGEMLLIGPAPTFAAVLDAKDANTVYVPHIIDFLDYVNQRDTAFVITDSNMLLGLAQQRLSDRVELLSIEGRNKLLRIRGATPAQSAPTP